jgi:hypothetical protein
MDAIRAVYTASELLDRIRIHLARDGLSNAQKDSVVRIALDEMEKVFAEAKAANPVPATLTQIDRLLLEKFGPDALKPPTDADDEPKA